VVNAGQNVGLVGLNLHATAAAVALLPAPEITIQESLIHRQPRRQSRQESNQGFSMRFSRCEVAQHKQLILTDELASHGMWCLKNT
jgi:hypothetical protein